MTLIHNPMKKILFFASLLSIFASGGCYDDNIEELNAGNGCDTLDSAGTAARAILFSADVLPIFNSTCGTNNSACHDATNATISAITFFWINRKDVSKARWIDDKISYLNHQENHLIT